MRPKADRLPKVSLSKRPQLPTSKPPPALHPWISASVVRPKAPYAVLTCHHCGSDARVDRALTPEQHDEGIRSFVNMHRGCRKHDPKHGADCPCQVRKKRAKPEQLRIPGT